MDLTLPQDMRDITREHIEHTTARHGPIDVVIPSTPCQGLSGANTKGAGLEDARSSLFEVAMDIMDMVTATNPDTKYIVENVDFEKRLPQDNAHICERLGGPARINAKDMSASSRTRLFWHNLGPGSGAQNIPLDADTFLEETGRLKAGRTTAPCLMANWQCKHRACRQRNTDGGTTWRCTRQ